MNVESNRMFTIIMARYIVIRRRQRKTRTIWQKNWIARREALGIENNLLRELRDEDESGYRNFIRVSVQDFEYLLTQLRPHITKKNTNMREAVSPTTRLALTLRYLATGDSFATLSYMFRLGRSTVSAIITAVVKKIYAVLRKDYLKTPFTSEEWEKVASDFETKWNFPNCVGALDGKHVGIKAPDNSGSDYFNYKRHHSIVLMAIADANYKFIYVNIGSKGRNSDGGVFSDCEFAKSLYKNQLNLPAPKPLPNRSTRIPFCIVADDALPLKCNIMKPISSRLLGVEERIYNYRTSRARRIIENAFGVASARFRVLRRTIESPPEKVKAIVSATCVLHNFLLCRDSSRIYAPTGTFDRENCNGTITPGTWRNEVHVPLNPLQNIGRVPASDAKAIQCEFVQYFNREGQVPWQHLHI